MTLSALNPPGAKWPGVSMAVIDRQRGVLVSTGHVGTGPDGNPVTSSVEDQVVALFENLKRTLAEAPPRMSAANAAMKPARSSRKANATVEPATISAGFQANRPSGAPVRVTPRSSAIRPKTISRTDSTVGK
mgnify:CR=1 FL=1